MIAFPPAKINLGLHILRRREDGYHDIETVMTVVDSLRDVLEIVPSRSGHDSMTCSGIAIDCPPEKNLVMKALRCVREAGRSVPAVDIFLHKNIPDGAGLGGGSSDASYTIRLLNDLFNLGMGKTEMSGIAAMIGSDCPFFIYDGPMLAQGRGEMLTPLSFSLPDNVTIRVVKPEGVSVSTAQAYAGVTPLDNRTKLNELLKEPVETWKDVLHNDFEDTILPNFPQIRQVKERMYADGAIYAAMSGSGSAVFGLFKE